MRRRQNILPCGRVYFFDEIGPRDIALKAKIRSILLRDKDELDKFSNYDNAGRKRKVWCKNAYNKFVSLLVKKLVDHLMESDRIKTRDGRMWCIATVRNESNRHANWHTDGAVMGVTIQGIDGDYRMLLSRKRRMELAGRINKGQKFHVNVNG